MGSNWRFVVSALACLSFIHIIQCADPEFPTMEELAVDSFTTEVQVTDVETQDTAYAMEMYDLLDSEGRLHLVVEREIKDVFYYNETNEVIEVDATTCLVWGIDETTYTTEDVFYGWHHPDPLVIGPSALLFYAQDRRKDIEYGGLQQIREIPNCDKFTLTVTNSQENILVHYYFAPKKWTTPYQVEKLRVPVRIHVVGNSSKNVEGNQWEQIELFNDFAYFKPMVDDDTDLQPPVGLGCNLRTKTNRFPAVPKAFRYAADLVDLVQASEHEKLDIRFEMVWYDYTKRLGRFDIYKKTSTLKSFQDYNTGVMFNYENGQNCQMKPMINAFFEQYDTSYAGHFKEPEEVLSLGGKFYEMGQRRIRGVTCDTFESVETDYEYEFVKYQRFVVTAYFAEDYTKVGVDSTIETRIPLQVTLTGWKDAKTMAFRKQYSIFSFSEDSAPAMYRDFELDKCYKNAETKSYFVMILDVPPEVAAKMEGQDDMVQAELKAEIVKTANIPDWRIPFFAIDYKTVGVYAHGLLLDRPPTLMQFDNMGKDDYKTQDKHFRMADARTPEDCAGACVEQVDCTGFYMCNEACFLKGEDPSDTHSDDDNVIDLGVCDEYLRDERGTTLEHGTPLKKAAEKLRNSALDGNLTVWITIQNGTEKIPVKDIRFGEGPAGDNPGDKPYSVNIQFRSIDSSLETSKAFADVDLLNSCYKMCQDMGSGCSSFSFCGRAKGSSKNQKPRCVVSSELIIRGKTNDMDLIQDESCNIYDLKYLEYFKKYPEQVSFLDGYKEITAVKTVEECAKNCRLDGKTSKTDVQICRGFEYCLGRKTCSLHKKHILDLKPGEGGTVSGKKSCVHYAARFIADYANLGTTLVDDTSNVRYQVSLEDCARVCSEELGDSCKSFNFCEDGTTCELSGKVLNDKDKPVAKDKCLHYEKRNNIMDWTKANAAKLSNTGYTKKGFTGLVIGMIALGIVVGVLGFVGYSYCRSRQYGESMSVRFARSDA